LEEYGCCDLGALVLPNFVEDGNFDWDMFDESIRLAVRFLDDVLTVNHYPLIEIKENCENVRRIGLGVMGLHTMLMKLGMKYDSKEAHVFVDKLFSVIKNTSYDASINLAIEKGPFPAYDSRFLDSGFVQTIKRGIRNKIKEHGIRNCALLTIAPTGTTSIVAGVSSGIEPIPAPVYWRTRFKSTEDGRRERAKELVVDKSYFEYPDVVQGAADISVENHFKMQKIVQRHIDNAVSKTINLPNDYPIEKLADLWLNYLPFMKGSTFYRWGSREFEPINPIPRAQWEEVMASQNGSTVYDFNVEDLLTIDCPGGVCELPQQWATENVEEPAA
jgi:ribonucleoside-diphosphate reductase alpha chain